MEANLNNSHQSTPFSINILAAGMHPEDSNIELWGDKRTKKVFFTQNGNTKPFSKLPHKYHVMLLEQMQNDKVAFKEILKQHGSALNGLEAYTFCKYGALDSSPDLSDDELAKCENFLCNSQLPNPCACLKWKKITVRSNGNTLTTREIQLLELIGQKKSNKEITEIFNISENTLKTHRDNLHKKFKVQSEQELILEAVSDHIIQTQPKNI
ncbi:hypothetical protein AXE80_10725 [Wenyingzhuangia fucanilytica]|uniref:HTH luxR-type domain-containing protein n=1 Tax=Wenyingzhuangia fucanilytica TaxID=1790137 RepID=A0A1B1Y7I9_9FLAO|nr:helix-turn-helix transcriptional regulator [Wenyingzhuangia fucanilytica]ANW96717.1 hypothetical protein AXE80_10725 [Wenyingzhuangia fucanilytica]